MGRHFRHSSNLKLAEQATVFNEHVVLHNLQALVGAIPGVTNAIGPLVEEG